jgi:DNA-binding MarR family transcriptional regulator
MSPEPLNEREFELINIIGRRLGSNQRDLSQHLNLSLGQTNMLVRRLVSKGFIRISQLDKRKVQYMLTPKGLSEKMRKAVKYTLNTINSLGLIKSNLKTILNDHYARGYRAFFIYSELDLTALVVQTFQELNLADARIVILNELPMHDVDGVLMVGKEKVILNGLNKNSRVDLLLELSKHEAPAGLPKGAA